MCRDLGRGLDRDGRRHRSLNRSNPHLAWKPRTPGWPRSGRHAAQRASRGAAGRTPMPAVPGSTTRRSTSTMRSKPSFGARLPAETARPRSGTSRPCAIRGATRMPSTSRCAGRAFFVERAITSGPAKQFDEPRQLYRPMGASRCRPRLPRARTVFRGSASARYRRRSSRISATSGRPRPVEDAIRHLRAASAFAASWPPDRGGADAAQHRHSILAPGD